MKKFYFLFSLFLTIFISAQATLTAVETPTGSGILKITYTDAANSWAFYNPNSAADIWLHCWVNSADNTTGNAYTDDWNNSLEKISWSAADNAYIGYVNLASHTFTQGKFPAGTTVYKFNIVMKNKQVGADYQSVDKSFTLSPSVIIPVLGLNDALLKSKSFVSDGKLYTAKQGNLSIQVVDFSGRIIKAMNVKSSTNGVELNLPKKGNYLLKVNDEVIKFAY